MTPQQSGCLHGRQTLATLYEPYGFGHLLPGASLRARQAPSHSRQASRPGPRPTPDLAADTLANTASLTDEAFMFFLALLERRLVHAQQAPACSK